MTHYHEHIKRSLWVSVPVNNVEFEANCFYTLYDGEIEIKKLFIKGCNGEQVAADNDLIETMEKDLICQVLASSEFNHLPCKIRDRILDRASIKFEKLQLKQKDIKK